MEPQSLSVAAATFAPMLFGIALLAALRLIHGPGDPLRYDPLHTVLSVVGWAAVVVGAMGSFLILVGITGIFWWIAAVVVFVEVFRRRREAQQRALLGLMAVAAERLIPLAPAVEAFGRERGGAFGLRATRFAGRLAAGMPLPAALAASPGLVPPTALPIVRAGCESGTLADALRRAADRQDAVKALWASVGGNLGYLLVVPFSAACILSFVMLKIVPSFARIFADYDADLPAMTLALIAAAKWLGGTWFFWLPLLLLLLLPMLLTMPAHVGLFRWDPLGLGRAMRRLDAANVLDALALVVRGGRPLEEGLRSLAESYPKWSIRRQLGGALVDVRSGRDCWESLCRRRLIRPADLAFLQAAQRLGNLSWALGEAADSNRRRLIYRLRAWLDMLFPPVVLALGLLVAFVIVSLFLPLVALIQKLV